MKKLFLTIMLLLSLSSCSYRSDNVSGNKMFHNGEVIDWNDSIAKLNL